MALSAWIKETGPVLDVYEEGLVRLPLSGMTIPAGNPSMHMHVMKIELPRFCQHYN